MGILDFGVRAYRGGRAQLEIAMYGIEKGNRIEKQ